MFTYISAYMVLMYVHVLCNAWILDIFHACYVNMIVTCVPKINRYTPATCICVYYRIMHVHVYNTYYKAMHECTHEHIHNIEPCMLHTCCVQKMLQYAFMRPIYSII